MTHIDQKTLDAIEYARRANGEFGSQTHSAPETALPAAGPARSEWADALNAAEERVRALAPMASRAVRDMVRAARPDAETVGLYLSDSGDGDMNVTVDQINEQDTDLDEDTLDKISACVRTYGYHRERLFQMPGMDSVDGDVVQFNLNDVEGPELAPGEYDAEWTVAWGQFEQTRNLVPAVLDEAMAKLEVDELVFEYADVDDDTRANLIVPGERTTAHTDIELTVNPYIVARDDFHDMPGFQMHPERDWVFTYTATR